MKIALRWAGFASLIGGEGLFRLEASGNGAVFFGGYGAVEAKDLNGELLVDTGHLLAYEPTVSLKIAMSGGIFSSIFGGEGLVSRVGGHGRIYLQTRSVEGLASWANGQFH